MRIWIFSICIVMCGCASTSTTQKEEGGPTKDNGTWLYLDSVDVPTQAHSLNHDAVFKKYVQGYNLAVFKAIDIVQAHAMDGGGYFIGKDAKPTESPLGYPIKLFGKPLLDPPRSTSYCSGSSYGIFIETLNLIFPGGAAKISNDRYESLRMQELDGGRREDKVKFWGKWNDDGPGTEYAMVQYSGMGEEISPQRARPGDFMNISWTSGVGHSVVFLGWFHRNNQLGMVYWSSQKGTNGFGDVALCPLTKVRSVKIVRLTHPEKLFTFDVQQSVNRDVPGDKIDITPH